ncbi:nucleotide kinase domain-containing protein [Amycolatopsis sp. NPDC006125]|uniref:nucleotide kinase domain-containing protein n=1 Tax=Amycolatopsis sp. NPDC006125 TaxID=3156730 RepID=UPI0033A68D13
MMASQLNTGVAANCGSQMLPLESDRTPVDAAPIQIAGRVLEPSPVFDTYWRFAAARQAVYLARVEGHPGPWTRDPILLRHRFTNCYRAADRVSQYLISNVSYAGDQTWKEVFFRTIVFKLFNRLSTWQLLSHSLGEVRWAEYCFDTYNRVLSGAFQAGEKLYSAAYVMPAPRLSEVRKHSNHLRLIELIMRSSAPQRIQDAATMKDAFAVLRNFPGLGDFLAYQYLIDLNYSAGLDFDEMEFVVPGPGARDGIRKCFGPASAGIEHEIIRYMADQQEAHFARLGLSFPGLWGRRLQLIDCQNLFCEVDKYARVAHPQVMGLSGRTRIKQTFRRDPAPVAAWFPPKWGINDLIKHSAGRASLRAEIVNRLRSDPVPENSLQLKLG